MNVANKLQATKLDTRLSGQGENAGEKRGKQEMEGRGAVGKEKLRSTCFLSHFPACLGLLKYS